MKNWKRFLALCLCGAMALSLSACGAAGQPTGGEPSDQPSDAPTPSAGPDAGATPEPEVDLTQDILAFSAGLSAGDELLTVNGTGMGADLALYWLAMSCNNFMSSYGMFGLSLSDYANMLRDDAVTLCTYNILLRQKAAQLGCLPTDAQVREARENMMGGGQENYDLLKTAYGLTDDSMEYIFTVNAYYDNVLDALVPEATGEMLNNYVYHVKHILLLTVDMEGQPVQQEDGSYAYPPLDDDTIAEKRALAEDLLSQLRASDDLEAKFDELMNRYSEDSGLQSNPDGYTATPGEMVPEFETTAFSLGFGEISDIVESSYGYHIILRGEVDGLDGYADECRESLLDEQLSGLLESAQVTRAAALDSLDVADFYTRYTAYQQAVVAGRQDSAPAEDGGAG